MRRRFALILITLVPCWGCGQPSPATTPVATVPARGKVTYKNKPLTKGSIVFEPTDRGKDATGKIQPDGSFELTTYKDKDGAVLGTHKVYVNGVPVGIIPPKFTHPSTSNMEAEVVEGKTEYPIALK